MPGFNAAIQMHRIKLANLSACEMCCLNQFDATDLNKMRGQRHLLLIYGILDCSKQLFCMHLIK